MAFHRSEILTVICLEDLLFVYFKCFVLFHYYKECLDKHPRTCPARVTLFKRNYENAISRNMSVLMYVEF